MNNPITIGFLVVLVAGMTVFGYQLNIAFQGPDHANERTWEYLSQFPIDFTQTECPIIDEKCDTSGHQLEEIAKQYPEQAETIRAEVDKIWEEERTEAGNQLNLGFVYAVIVGAIGIPALALVARKKEGGKKA